MKAVKQHLARMRWANSGRYGWGTPSQGYEEIPETVSEQKPTVRTSFTPGVIIHLQLDTPISDVKKFKVIRKSIVFISTPKIYSSNNY